MYGTSSVGCLCIIFAIIAFNFLGFWEGVLSTIALVLLGWIITKLMYPKQYEDILNKKKRNKEVFK